MNRRAVLKKTALLTGTAWSAPGLLTALGSCTSPQGIDWKPVYITLEQATELEAITETILPATDTPGAREAGVPAFIEKLLHEVYKPDERDGFMEGLTAFGNKVKSEQGDVFSDLPAGKRLEIIRTANREALNGNGTGNRPWFLEVKELTLLGYFSSEIGATQVLQYDAVPGRYRGCVPLAELEKAWAT